ncbi:MAG: hypothetical protein WC124_03865 [Desulfoplanes sp.]
MNAHLPGTCLAFRQNVGMACNDKPGITPGEFSHTLLCYRSVMAS